MSASIPELRSALYRLSHEHGFREVLNELVYMARTTQEIEQSNGDWNEALTWWRTANCLREAEQEAKAIRPTVRP